MKNKIKDNFSEWFTEIINEAELADIRYNVKGFIVFRPWSVLTMEKMYDYYETELQNKGHMPAWFPVVIPESNFKLEAEHVEGFIPEVFWVTEHGDGEKFEEKLALRPTSETAMYKMYSLWVQGLTDLPLKIYQRGSVYRHETKATRPFLRSREFYWIEAHNCFATEQEAVDQTIEDMNITEKVMHDQFCIPFIQFQRPEWDKFPGAVHTYAADIMMPDGKVLQLPSTHLLGQNFSKPFDVKFQDEKGNKSYVWQTCYGPAISRIYGGMIAVLGDDQGLRLPFNLAPVQVVIVPIMKSNDSDNGKVLEYCEKIKSQLQMYRVKIDKASKTPGYKYNYWEMKGVPLRIEVGLREVTESNLTLALRTRPGKQNKINVAFSDIGKVIIEQGDNVTQDLKQYADEQFENVIHNAEDMSELVKILDNGGFARVPFCSIGKDGEGCADNIKSETHGDVRGTKVSVTEKPVAGQKCIYCGKPANHIVYIARQY